MAITALNVDEQRLCDVRERILGIEDLQAPVTEVVYSPINGISSFFIGPDGSKEGKWRSDLGDRQRDEIVVILKEAKWLTWCELQYGAGPGTDCMLRTNYTEISEDELGDPSEGIDFTK